jgi:hypothetical protein
MDRDLRAKKINEPSVASRRSTLGNELDLAFGRFAPITVGLSQCGDCRKPPPGHAAPSPTV